MRYSEYFELEELVHPDIYNHPAIGDRCENFLHPNTRYMLDDIREFSGPLVINDWHIGGNYINSGLRQPNGDVGAIFSTHRFGCAFDLKPTRISANILYFYLLNNQKQFPFITRIECIDNTPGWVHIEIGNKREGDIEIFKP